MTRKSRARLDRDRRRIPRKDNIASVTVDHKNEQIIFTTNDMLVKQIHRDGPRLARSFDRLTKKQIAECSAVFGQVQGLMLRHLPRLADDGFKATSARLLASASNSLVASIEVARHGYRRQYGVLARTFIEAVATVIALATKENALQQFHAGRLDSNKCITWAKAAVPPIGPLWGMLSREFVHIGKGHSAFEPPSLYTADDEALAFIINSLRGNVLLLHVVADLIFSDETDTPRYWKRNGQVASFDPTPEVGAWMESFLEPIDTPLEDRSVS